MLLNNKHKIKNKWKLYQYIVFFIGYTVCFCSVRALPKNILSQQHKLMSKERGTTQKIMNGKYICMENIRLTIKTNKDWAPNVSGVFFGIYSACSILLRPFCLYITWITIFWSELRSLWHVNCFSLIIHEISLTSTHSDCLWLGRLLSAQLLVPLHSTQNRLCSASAGTRRNWEEAIRQATICLSQPIYSLCLYH